MAAILSMLAIPAAAGADVLSMGSNLVGTQRYFTADVGFPMFGTLDHPTAVPVTTLSSDEPGTMTFVRYAFESTVEQSIAMTWTPGAATVTSRTDTLTFDSSRAPNSGWQEIRVSPNFATPDRRFITTRLCVNAVNGKPRSDYCGGPTTRGRCGGGSWYAATAYSVSTVDCRELAAGVHAGQTIHVHFQTGSGGYGLVTADPAGTHVLSGRLPANTWTTYTVPQDVSGVWLLSVESNGQDGGYYLPIS